MSSLAFVPDILFALAKQGFEARLIEGGALVIFDLRYPEALRSHVPGEPQPRVRAPPEHLAKLVFANASRIARRLRPSIAPGPAQYPLVSKVLARFPGSAVVNARSTHGGPVSDGEIVALWRNIPFESSGDDVLACWVDCLAPRLKLPE
jgi:hypothetical protein